MPWIPKTDYKRIRTTRLFRLIFVMRYQKKSFNKKF